MPPLTGITVLDLTRLLPGGMCTLLLADLGADVIKVEEPDRGDYLRAFPPLVDGTSALFLALNRGKRSITLNLKNPRGRALLLELASSADVLIEGFRPGVLARLGLDWEMLHRACPRLIVCAISGYGQQGPLAQRVGHDLNYMGLAGALPLFAPRGGGSPHVPGMQIADLGGGALPAAVGVLAALVERGRTGEGSYVDVSMTDGVLSWLATYVAQAWAGDTVAGGTSALTGGAACYSIYTTGDNRYLTLAAVEERFWANFCRLVGRETFIKQQWSDWPEQQALFTDLDALFRTRTLADWLVFFGDAEVCIAPVLSIEEALDAAQTRGSERVLTFDNGTTTPLRLPAGLFGTSATSPPPALGEHTGAVLEGLGYNSDVIAQLRETGVV